MYAPDALVENPVLGQEHAGTMEIRKFFEDYFDVVEDPRIEATEVIERDDCVVFAVRLKGRLRHTGISDEAITTEMAHAFRVRDSKVVWNYVCMTQTEALEAVGLSE